MSFMTKDRLKKILAGLGVVYLVLFGGYLVYAGLNRNKVHGPSEIELHPEKEAEIRAKERAEELRNRLKLSDEQTKQVAYIFQKYQPMGSPGGPPPGDPRERFQALRGELAKVLTPEQQALQEQMGPPRGPGGGRGGPGGPGRGLGGPPGMNSERMDALKSAMTPEQKERFEKQLERMKNMRPPGRPPGGRGAPGGPPDGPGGPDGPPPPPGM